jgi:adenylate cyclase
MLRFQVHNKRENQDFEHLAGPIEFGRGGPRNNVPRCVIQDPYVSTHHVHVLELPGGRVRVQNLSTRNSIRLEDGTAIPTGGTSELDPPLRLVIGETALDVDVVRDDPVDVTVLGTVAPPVAPRTGAGLPSLLALGRAPAPEMLAHWFETVVAVQRAAAGSPEFYEQTARAVVELVGLDRGLVLLRPQGRWMVQARHPDTDSWWQGPQGREFSLSVLERMERERRTFFQSTAGGTSTVESLRGVEAVVAAPIFDTRDQVVGAIYACRTRFTPQSGQGIGPLEAQVIQLLASTAGVGLARLEQEAEASRLRVQFEQFFSADLARELQKNPRLLEGQVREITVLFSDIRNFSRMSERLGPADTCRLVCDVMEAQTARIREHDGVLVDYSGDGLIAMWNAPADHPDHAAKGCRAALAMLADLPQVAAGWQERLESPLRLGVGLNTGQALCGNTGSKFKFKYGPLGHAVNLASRVEGATKHLGIPLLITGSTRAQIGDAFATRRLGRVRVVGIETPVDLYELHAETATPEWCARRDTYEKALALYEAGDWAAAHSVIAPLVAGPPDHDLPSINLAGRALEALRSCPEHRDTAFELNMK